MTGRATQPHGGNNNRSSTLTCCEEEIATLVAQGITNRQVASELSISEHTAASHVRRILKKLGLQSLMRRARLVADRATPVLL